MNWQKIREVFPEKLTSESFDNDSKLTLKSFFAFFSVFFYKDQRRKDDFEKDTVPGFQNTPALHLSRGDEWSLRAFASMPSTAMFLRARAEIKNLLCELASNAKIWGARATEHSLKFCEQIEQS